MCEKCTDLDFKIERCRRLLALVTDQIALDGIDALEKSYVAEKAGLHSEPSSEMAQLEARHP